MPENPWKPAYSDCYGEMLASIGREYGGKENLTAFGPLVGSKYRAGSGTLIVGRAPNSWGAGLPAKKLRDEGQRRSILRDLQEDPDARSFDYWIEKANPSIRASQRPPKRPTATTSAFFRVARAATGVPDKAPGWSRLAWTNLYKVAPADGGNPGSILQRLQGGAARELFHMEIAALRPKIILVLAGEVWFDEFGKREGLGLKKPRRGGGFVEGVAALGGRRWIVAHHPQTRREHQFAEAIKNCLADLQA